jgi:hypothetical protein
LDHLLFECPFAIQVWNSAGIWYDVQHAAMQSDSAVNTIFYLLQKLPMNIKQRVAAILWSLWKHRNLKIWDNVDENSAQVLDRARNMIEDWHEANLPRTGSIRQAGAQLQQPATSLQTHGQHHVTSRHHSAVVDTTEQWEVQMQCRCSLFRTVQKDRYRCVYSG